ncbi:MULTISPECIES: hypothetical protein [Streptomyces]|uniref:hypothetical protein n=1 Tax=Streptomyces TaxID=1883 RepID=UPI00163C8AF6|nr:MULTISPECIES: hypothetical protein [Streptomyces]MBC2878061.1 hypothetical protein [Streptomyces sp. TYQ1024]UBI40013.1 hypothetical protein K7I03_28475 [Streptomyces mobaraensis]UKW32594.1 hypothetical protein MCU78_28405 [Streptomyces sp. TYQ1024]
MPDATAPRPPHISTIWAPVPDRLTPQRDITHAHFRPGEQVVIVKGVADGELWGDAMTVVTPSWHTPTDEDGWRLRNPNGGERTYITAHPRYMIHLSRRCADCLIHHRALKEILLPAYATATGIVDCGWYSVTALNQLVHVDDARSGR